MSNKTLIENYLARAPIAAVLLYIGAVVLFVFTAWVSISGIIERQAAVVAATDILNQLEGRGTASRKSLGAENAAATGSPFLEGATVTVAGAALLQRVAAAVTRFGGNTLSTQVELQGTQSKAGFISVVASCEVDQAGLQKLLYDLEAGMPFLFIDQLVIQAPMVAANASDGKLRLLLGISGQWQGAK
jgi:general secretion pathway protein M